MGFFSRFALMPPTVSRGRHQRGTYRGRHRGNTATKATARSRFANPPRSPRLRVPGGNAARQTLVGRSQTIGSFSTNVSRQPRSLFWGLFRPSTYGSNPSRGVGRAKRPAVVLPSFGTPGSKKAAQRKKGPSYTERLWGIGGPPPRNYGG